MLTEMKHGRLVVLALLLFVAASQPHKVKRKREHPHSLEAVLDLPSHSNGRRGGHFEFAAAITGESAASMKDSEGDHIVMSFGLANGVVEMVVDKTSQKTGNFYLQAKPEGFEVTETDMEAVSQIKEDAEHAMHANNPNAYKRYEMVIAGAQMIAMVGNKIESFQTEIQMSKLDETELEPEPGHGKGKGNGGRHLLSSNSSRALLSTCSGVVEPRGFEPNCPYRSSGYRRTSAVKCICPYFGSGLVTAKYRTGSWWRGYTTYAWRRHYGGNYLDCPGRCGQGCSGSDKEAFLACLVHDTCLNHFGTQGSKGYSPSHPQCGDEWLDAAASFIASFGWRCWC